MERGQVPTFESPVVKQYPAGVGPLTLADLSHLAKLSVRADDDPGFGVGFGASRTDGGVLVCGQRPGEWVLLGSPAEVARVSDGIARSGHVSVIDLTHGRAVFRLTGTDASAVLEKVCSLDWSDPMTPDGAVASASVAKVVCDLVRHDVDGRHSYLISCDRSFGQYLFDAILDAGAELDIVVGAP